MMLDVFDTFDIVLYFGRCNNLPILAIKYLNRMSVIETVEWFIYLFHIKSTFQFS